MTDMKQIFVKYFFSILTRIIGNLNPSQKSHIFRCLLYSLDYKRKFLALGHKEGFPNVNKSMLACAALRQNEMEAV